jgi:hypothetical protein
VPVDNLSFPVFRRADFTCLKNSSDPFRKVAIKSRRRSFNAATTVRGDRTLLYPPTSLKIVVRSILLEVEFALLKKDRVRFRRTVICEIQTTVFGCGSMETQHALFGQDQIRKAKPVQVPSTTAAHRQSTLCGIVIAAI